MLRAYQSPSSGTDCGPQCAQMPNLASRNQSGHLYCLSDSQVGLNGPSAMVLSPVVAGLASAACTFVEATSAQADAMRTKKMPLRKARTGAVGNCGQGFMGNNLQNLVTQNIQWSGYALGPPLVVPVEVADAGKSADRGRQTANSRWSQNHRLRLLTEPKALPWTFGR